MPRNTVDACDLVQHAGFLRTLGRRLLLSEHEIDDASQDAYLTGLTKPTPEEPRRRPWIASVFTNASRQARRAQGRRRLRERRSARPEQVASAADLAARREVMRRVSDAVLALREPYRTAVLLRFYEGLPPRAMAAQLHVPVETVKSQVKRALRQLRVSLDGDPARGGASWRAALLPIAGLREMATGSLATTTGALMASKSTIGWAAVGVGAIALATGGIWMATADESAPAPLQDARALTMPDEGPPSTDSAPVQVPKVPVMRGEAPRAVKPKPGDSSNKTDDDHWAGRRAAAKTSLQERVQSVTLADFTFEDKPLSDLVQTLQIVTGMNLMIAPTAMHATENVEVTIEVRGATVEDILDLITEPYDLTWDVRGNVIVIDEKKDEAQDEDK